MTVYKTAAGVAASGTFTTTVGVTGESSFAGNYCRSSRRCCSYADVNRATGSGDCLDAAAMGEAA